MGEGARNSQHFRRIHVVLPLAHAFITPGVPDESTRCVLPGSWHPLLASPPSAPALAPALGVAALGASLYLLGVARVASTDERDLLDRRGRPAGTASSAALQYKTQPDIATVQADTHPPTVLDYMKRACHMPQRLDPRCSRQVAIRHEAQRLGSALHVIEHLGLVQAELLPQL